MLFRKTVVTLGLACLWLSSGQAAESETRLPELISTTGGGSQWSNLEELKKAATDGNPKACASLGELYVNGDQVAKDIPRGVGLLEQAAQKGNPDAAFRLGKLYDDGETVTRDYPRAIEYYRAAALAGVSTAQYNLGVIYAGAHGVKRDFAEGLAWLIVGTKNGAPGDGEKQAREHLTKIKRMDLIEAAEKRAVEITGQIHVPEQSPPAPPSSNSTPSTTSPQKKKSNRPPGAKPKTQASSSARSPATVAGPPGALPVAAPASFKLPEGIHGSPTPEAGPAVKLATPSGNLAQWPSLAALERDAGQKIPAALYALGQVLLDGKLAPADPERAVGLLENGAKVGNVDAAYQLGEIYTRGVLAPKSDEKAFAYSLQAAKGGIAFAMFNVGGFYANGRGTPRDYSEALTWLMVAKKNGVDRGGEDRIRAYLVKSEPEKIPIAERRAADLERDLTANIK